MKFKNEKLSFENFSIWCTFRDVLWSHKNKIDEEIRFVLKCKNDTSEKEISSTLSKEEAIQLRDYLNYYLNEIDKLKKSES